MELGKPRRAVLPGPAEEPGAEGALVEPGHVPLPRGLGGALGGARLHHLDRYLLEARAVEKLREGSRVDQVANLATLGCESAIARRT